MRTTNSESGLTLIELAIVLTIVAILAAVAIPRFVDLSGKAGDAAVFSTASSVLSAYSVATAQNTGTPNCTQLFNALGLIAGAGTNPPTATVTAGGSTTSIQCDATNDQVKIWNNKADTHNSAGNAMTLSLPIN
jgi:MSHA pilin protein MshA